MTLVADVDAFFGEHRDCADLDGARYGRRGATFAYG
jgi:hypothetical protein